MDLGLSGKVAWVNGASSGLGLAAARSLAAEGASVAISARRAKMLAENAAAIESDTGSRCIAVPLDVTDAEAIVTASQRVVEELGGIDILVANSGGPPPGTFAGADDATLQVAFESTTASAWRLAQAVLPSMRERGGGCIVFITSSSTIEIIQPLLFSNMMRPAVVGMAKTMSRELASSGIRIVCVAPGRIATDRGLELDELSAAASGRTVAEVRAETEARIPMGRYGDPSEIGDVVAFVASERASFLTGVTVLVDGGTSTSLLA